MPKAGLADCLANKPTPRLDQHLNQVLSARFIELLDHFLSIGQKPSSQSENVGRTQKGAGQAHRADLKHGHRSELKAVWVVERQRPTRLDQETLDDKIGARSDQ